MNSQLAHRIVEAAKREDAAWRVLTNRLSPDEEVAAATEYVEAAVALTVEIDNHRTMEAMKR